MSKKLFFLKKSSFFLYIYFFNQKKMKFTERKVVAKLIKKLKNKRLKSADASWYDVLALLWHKVSDYDFREKASTIAFNFTLATFPALIFLFTLLPYMPIDNAAEQILAFLQEVMPAGLYESAVGTITDILHKPNRGLLSFGFLLALYTATNGVLILINSFDNSIDKAYHYRGWLRKRIASIGLTVMLFMLMIISVACLFSGKYILRSLVSSGYLDRNFFFYLLDVIRYLVVGLTGLVGTAIIYYVGPSVRLKNKLFSRGAWVATVLNFIVTVGFSLYLEYFSNFNRVYGSIGTMIGYMLWLYLLANVMMLGHYVNVVFSKLRGIIPGAEEVLNQEATD